MAKKKIFKHVVVTTFYTEEAIGAEGMSLADIAYQMDEGDAVGTSHWQTTDVPLEGKDAVKATHDVGSEPSFFRMDEDGNEMDVDEEDEGEESDEEEG